VDGHLLTPTIDVAAWCRAGLLDDDLRRLGGPAEDLPAGTEAVPAVRSVEKARGTIYMLAGSALAGRMVARRAQERLGGGLPVAFFTGAAGPALGPAWRALQAGLDGFGAAAPASGSERVVRAARRTFEAMGARLSDEPVVRVGQPVP